MHMHIAAWTCGACACTCNVGSESHSCECAYQSVPHVLQPFSNREQRRLCRSPTAPTRRRGLRIVRGLVVRPSKDIRRLGGRLYGICGHPGRRACQTCPGERCWSRVARLEAWQPSRGAAAAAAGGTAARCARSSGQGRGCQRRRLCRRQRRRRHGRLQTLCPILAVEAGAPPRHGALPAALRAHPAGGVVRMCCAWPGCRRPARTAVATAARAPTTPLLRACTGARGSAASDPDHRTAPVRSRGLCIHRRGLLRPPLLSAQTCFLPSIAACPSPPPPRSNGSARCVHASPPSPPPTPATHTARRSVGQQHRGGKVLGEVAAAVCGAARPGPERRLRPRRWERRLLLHCTPAVQGRGAPVPAPGGGVLTAREPARRGAMVCTAGSPREGGALVGARGAQGPRGLQVPRTGQVFLSCRRRSGGTPGRTSDLHGPGAQPGPAGCQLPGQRWGAGRACQGVHTAGSGTCCRREGGARWLQGSPGLGATFWVATCGPYPPGRPPQPRA